MNLTCSNNLETRLDFLEPFTISEDSVLDFLIMKQLVVSLYCNKVERWLAAMDLYDQAITAHTLRVTAISMELGRQMGLGQDDLNHIQFGTLLHDIGKLGVPGAIIQKPGTLTPDEMQVVQKHPVYAHEWISKQDDFQPAKVIPLFHHEKWDGSGYPYKLRGKEIPLLARVVAIVDVWDAVTSDRPYRPAMNKKHAIQLIKSESGKHFDPDIVKAFLQLGVMQTRRLPYSSALLL